ncbi:MAG: acetylglutamate kinase [Planctomycetota bacterium]|nr:acetylglutamate kinase [Planctomycetota bacterium]
MRILLKIGGAQIEQALPRAELCQAIAIAHSAGHELILVHGGGNQIRKLNRALGIEDRYHEGLRITDSMTAEVALMVLGGQVNRTLVCALQHAGVAAAGISGADGATFSAHKLVKPGVDLGFVGAVGTVNPKLVQSLLSAGFVPVIATVAPGANADGSEPFYNLNADHAAGPLCNAFQCDALLFLTDVPGVLGADRQTIAMLTPDDCAQLLQTGVASGGMLPKLEAALLALKENPCALIKIAPAGSPNAVLSALQKHVGTTFRN